MTAPEIVRYGSPEDFLDACRDLLEAHEATHSLLLGVAEELNRYGSPGAAPLLAAVLEEGQPRLAALRVPGHPLLLAAPLEGPLPSGSLERLVQDLQTRGDAPAETVAATPLAEAFVAAWSRATGRPGRLRLRQRLHVLTRVSDVRRPPGDMRRATDDDGVLVARWIEAFHAETHGPGSEPPRAIAERRVAAGQIVLWIDGEPRAMAGHARATRHGVSVNAVYTPPEARGHGYATALVAELSRTLLDEGRRFCVLFTDLANPTSNAIYARIGYRPLEDFLFYALDS